MKDNINKEPGPSVTSGIRKYPTDRNVALKNAHVWLKGKQVDDGVFPLWRVHNKLYDLTKFISRHPGGRFWIESTRGTDVTEVFESSHIGEVAESILKKFYVRDIVTPRVSPFTFDESGFYKTLKRKVAPILKRVGAGPTRKMLFIQDFLLLGFISFGLMAGVYNSVFFAVVSGLFMALMTGASHNFFHQKDNWRMYVFDLTMASSEEWRISHALSHHAFPNTILDYEINMFEPHLELLPNPHKSFGKRFLFLVPLAIFYTLGFFFDNLRKVPLVLMGRSRYLFRDLLPLIEVFVIVSLSSTFSQGIKLWFTIQCTGTAMFSLIGLTAAHHHPDIYHEGDVAPNNKDWGLHQVIATRERGEAFVSSLLLVATSFGNHTLHHLFPTVDHSKLPYLMDPFLETCREFGVKFEIFSPWQHCLGFHKQLSSVTPNKNYPSVLKEGFVAT